jgi:hypothetical protein
MFEKLPAARMNNRENSSTKRLIAAAHELRGEHRLQDASRHFPSYLRPFGIFFGLLTSESHWGAARLLAGCCGRFPTAPPNVAFL